MELPLIWDESMESSEEDLTPRPYQSQVLDRALVQNTIVFLPTGSGKTFIAVMLIKRLSADIQEKFSNGGKRTFFLVNTVALAEQQKNFIKRHACVSVGHYTGDMNVDYWAEEKWREELDKNQVLVMTAQILLDILNHNYLQLSSINLLVFDECHHAVNQHCMSKIMKHFDHYPEEEQPRVLGLTATLLNASVKYHRVPETVTVLEDTFKSKIATIENVTDVERYCSVLPQDTYTKLVPYWFLVDQPVPPYQCILQLPINSPLKDGFKGKKMPNKKLAKQSAAFAACVALHKAGELNNHLLPVGHSPEQFIDEEKIFNLYQKASENESMEQPGTKKCRRTYSKQVPKSMIGCALSERDPLYMHVLYMTPSYEEPPEDNTRRHAFYELLQTKHYFAILSSKKLPELCDFPVYLNVGQIAVHLVVNNAVLYLQSHEISSLQRFHAMLFFDLLKLNKSYVLADPKSEENNFLIVPVTKQEQLDTYLIDWNVVKSKCHLPAFKQPTEAERLGKDCEWSKFQHSLVVPWYRGLPPDQVYVVTQVCEDLSPLSAFPTSAFSTFEEYFHGKYSLVIHHSSQPLFEVKAITSHLNCLKPRSGNMSGRSKRKEANDDFEEHLVPELCISIDFPSSLWIKAVCLPSCLHRITHLLLAEELRQEIAEDLNFQPHAGEKLQLFPIDPVCLSEDEDKPKRSVSRSGAKGNAGILSTKTSLWGGEGEPVDIDRERVEDVTLMDILYYDEFINKPAVPIDDSSLDVSEIMKIEVPSPEEIVTPAITLLQENHGVQLSKILQALTCACSNDALNLERLETLGDSFLKFASSLFLFLRYPKLDEGKLTQVKGKIVGNRNLF
ncbi:hypothetical protein R5R35_001277 [Gryllus longicercus]|uniref:Uncharacterized protein n=1 Tax=Gryllus longicercus TaxID=2509291 RepID=A0AAN9VIY6_9ORTH